MSRFRLKIRAREVSREKSGSYTASARCSSETEQVLQKHMRSFSPIGRIGSDIAFARLIVQHSWSMHGVVRVQDRLHEPIARKPWLTVYRAHTGIGGRRVVEFDFR